MVKTTFLRAGVLVFALALLCALPLAAEATEVTDWNLALSSGLSWSDTSISRYIDNLSESPMEDSSGWYSIRLAASHTEGGMFALGFEGGLVVCLDEDLPSWSAFDMPAFLTFTIKPRVNDTLAFPFTFGAGLFTGFDGEHGRSSFGPVAHASAGVQVSRDHFFLTIVTRVDLTLRLLTELAFNSTLELRWSPVVLSFGARF